MRLTRVGRGFGNDDNGLGNEVEVNKLPGNTACVRYCTPRF